MTITPDTQLLLPVGVLCTFITALIAVTWRLSKFVQRLVAELRTTWSFRDQERWALQLERENRGIKLFVPDVQRAPTEEKKAD